MEETKKKIREQLEEQRQRLLDKSPLELISSEYESSVKNVKLGDDTKAILICKAKISDIFSTLSDIEYREFGNDLPKEFVDAWFALDKSLNSMIMDYIDYNLSNSNFLEM